jgi:PAS domain-containing protein
MANYALITGTAVETIDLYSEVVRREGLEAVLVRDPEETRRIVSEKGRPKLVIADLEMNRDSGFKLLREVQSSIPDAERPIVVAAVSRELRTTAGDLMDALGITEVLPSDADARSIGATVHRVLTQDARPNTDLCPPPVPEGDVEQHHRVARAASTGLDDAPPDKALQDLVSHTAEAFSVPYAIVSVTLDDGHWFKSHAHLPSGPQEARNPTFDAAFCAYVVDAGHPVLVSDATMHPTFVSHPLVRGGIVACFAGAPIVTRDGDALGSVCILDAKPGAIPAACGDVLGRLAKRVANDIEQRDKSRASALEVIRLNEKLSQERERHQLSKGGLALFEAVLSQLDGGVLVIDREQRVAYANRAAGELLDLPAHRMMGMPRVELLRECAVLFEDPEAFLAKMSPVRIDLKTFTCDLEQERPVVRLVRWSVKPIELPDGLGQLFHLMELEQRAVRPVSGRYSVVPALASTRPAHPVTSRPPSARASNTRASAARATGTGRAKRKG